MIKTLDNILPHGTNRGILNELIQWRSWTIANETAESPLSLVDDNRPNTGFSIISFHRKYNVKMNVLLNNYADIVYFTLKEKYNWGALEKVNWNYYDNSATTQEHKDESNEFISAVYSLHTNDGGTEVKGKFYPSIEGQAIIFDSDVLHRGVPPKNDRHRFNLSIVVKK